MPKLIIDGETVECSAGTNVLQAALEAGYDVPHYCYHPRLSVVASCRLCLMEMKAFNPRSKQLEWLPRLVPSCQTPVRDNPDGSPMEVRFDSPAVQSNQRHVMEYLLINHPLDCPVCDQAGECYLQDYSQKFGHATSRMVEEKQKNPKKNIGSKTWLYQDRCVMCTRCVRFCREVAGTGELCVVNRGDHAEIDVFPGFPLENPLQGNVVDICPVGCLLDKDFLFKQRVWLLHETPSITVADSSGANIQIDHNEGRVYRLKPRYNPQANGFWISDEQRFSYKHVHDERRLKENRRRTGILPVRGEVEAAGGTPVLQGMTEGNRRDACSTTTGKMPVLSTSVLPSEAAGEWLADRLEEAVQKHGAGGSYVLLSPFLSNEEAWMIAGLARKLDPEATLGLGPVPVEGQDQLFPVGTTDPSQAKFIIRAEKCPNRRGVAAVLTHFGGPRLDYGTDGEQLFAALRKRRFHFVWITGGEPKVEAAWRTDLARMLAEMGENRPETVILQDLFTSPLCAQTDLVIASGSFAERSGTFTNGTGLTQPFEAAIDPVGDFRPDGEWLWTLTRHIGLYDPETILEEMSAGGIRLERCEAPVLPTHQH